MALDFICESAPDSDTRWGLLSVSEGGKEALELLELAEDFDEGVLEDWMLMSVWWFGFSGEGFDIVVGLFLDGNQWVEKCTYLLLKYIMLQLFSDKLLPQKLFLSFPILLFILISPSLLFISQPQQPLLNLPSHKQDSLDFIDS